MTDKAELRRAAHEHAELMLARYHEWRAALPGQHVCPENETDAVVRAVVRRMVRGTRSWSARAQRLNARASRVGAAGRVTGAQLQALVARFESRCAYCEEALDFMVGRPAMMPVHDPLLATFDHVRSLSMGGSGDIGNLVPACITCNNARARAEKAA